MNRDPMRAYHAYATGNVSQAGMNYLSDLIIRPGIEKTFGPLLLYRGNMNRGHAHRLWNFALLMMACDCETLSDGFRTLNNPAFSQLCGPPKPPGRYNMWNFFGRLHDNPAVTRNVEGLTQYVKLIGHDHLGLKRVDRFSDRINVAPWRVSLHDNAGQDYRDRERGIPQSQQLFYPFIAHDTKKPDKGKELVLLVNNEVPRYWPEHVRADVCQDIVMAILSGALDRGDVHDHVRRYVAKHFQTLPLTWEGGQVKLSMDATFGNGNEATMHDTISDDYRFGKV